MRYKVPQDVQQADKIVGPLTAVQLVEAVIGGGVAYFFFKNIGGGAGVVAAAIIGGRTVLLVFVRVNEMSFPKFLVAMALYMFRPRIRTWKKLADAVLPPLGQQQAPGQTAAQKLAAEGPAANVRDIVRVVDAGSPGMGEEDEDLHPLEEDAFGREGALERIRKLDERLRSRQGTPVNPDALAPANADAN